jgi:hypothetical protein
MMNIRIPFTGVSAVASHSKISSKGGNVMASPRSEVSKVLLIQ